MQRGVLFGSQCDRGGTYVLNDSVPSLDDKEKRLHIKAETRTTNKPV